MIKIFLIIVFYLFSFNVFSQISPLKPDKTIDAKPKNNEVTADSTDLQHGSSRANYRLDVFQYDPRIDNNDEKDYYIIYVSVNFKPGSENGYYTFSPTNFDPINNPALHVHLESVGGDFKNSNLWFYPQSGPWNDENGVGGQLTLPYGISLSINMNTFSGRIDVPPNNPNFLDWYIGMYRDLNLLGDRAKKPFNLYFVCISEVNEGEPLKLNSMVWYYYWSGPLDGRRYFVLPYINEDFLGKHQLKRFDVDKANAGTISISPDYIKNGDSLYYINENITIEAKDNPGYTFKEWSCNGNLPSGFDKTKSKVTFQLKKNLSLTANYTVTDVYEDSKVNNSFIITPNPVYDNIKINIQPNGFFVNHLQIINNLGISVFEKTYFNDSQENSIQIDTKDFPAGVYYCILKCGYVYETKKFVILK